MKQGSFIFCRHFKTEFTMWTWIWTETYFQHPVWFLHQTCTTVTQTHWAVVQKPPRTRLSDSETNKVTRRTVCEICLRRTKINQQEEERRKEMLETLSVDFQENQAVVKIHSKRRSGPETWNQNYMMMSVNTSWSILWSNHWFIDEQHRHSISIESHFASAAPCSSALGEFIVQRGEDWMTDSCPSWPQKSCSSETWALPPSSSGLSSAAASQVKSRASDSSVHIATSEMKLTKPPRCFLFLSLCPQSPEDKSQCLSLEQWHRLWEAPSPSHVEPVRLFIAQTG